MGPIIGHRRAMGPLPGHSRSPEKPNDPAVRQGRSETPGPGHEGGSRKGATFVRVAVGFSALTLVFSAFSESFERGRPSLAAATVVFCYMKEQ